MLDLSGSHHAYTHSHRVVSVSEPPQKKTYEESRIEIESGSSTSDRNCSCILAILSNPLPVRVASESLLASPLATVTARARIPIWANTVIHNQDLECWEPEKGRGGADLNASDLSDLSV